MNHSAKRCERGGSRAGHGRGMATLVSRETGFIEEAPRIFNCSDLVAFGIP